MSKLLRLLAINVGVGTSVLLLALGAMEGYLRVRLDPKYAPRPIFIDRNEKTGWATSANLHHVFYAPDYAIEIVTDQHGYRLGARGPARPDDRLVVLVGDSYTFGWGVSTADTFASYLDEALATVDARLRVVNTAVSGFATLSYADRLAEFISRFGTGQIDSIFVLHVDNDPADNVDYLLFRSGFYEPRVDPGYSPRSTLRVWNLLRHTWMARGPMAPPEYDVNFRYPMARTARTAGPLRIDGEEFGDFDDYDMTRETSVPQSKASKHLTPLQLRLMRLGLRRINCAAPNGGLTVHHAIINLADSYTIYADAMAEAFDGMPSCGNTIKYHGLIPLTAAQLAIPAHNTHSGGHFTPAFNKVYAEILLRLIVDDR